MTDDNAVSAMERIALAMEKQADALVRQADAAERQAAASVSSHEASKAANNAIREARLVEKEAWELRKANEMDAMEDRRRRNAALDRVAGGYGKAADMVTEALKTGGDGHS